MRSHLFSIVVSGGLLSIAVSVPVLAVPTKASSLTCEEFVVLDDVVKPKIVYWAEGFNKKGKSNGETIDVAETDKLVPILVTECAKTPKAPLSQKIKEQTGAANKQSTPPTSAAVKNPKNMKCDEFVALDDVVKPKVVYWAEGYNKKGKQEGLIDVKETDDLVPVLVDECKQTPKLSLWQKFKKHF
jgi:hypothetical protein